MAELETYRLDELTRRLLPPDAKDEEVYRAKRRIQNWVTSGLITPVTPKHEGRGFHRRFDSHELCKAAVLLELVKYRLDAVLMEQVARKFDRAHPSRRDEWGNQEEDFGHLVEKVHRGEDGFVHIQWLEKEPGRGGPRFTEAAISWGASLNLVPQVPSQIIISLAPLFGGLK